MTTEDPHISVCICTYKRPVLLKRLLETLQRQDTKGEFTYSVVIADNDSAESARNLVQSFQRMSKLEVQYCVEPEQNIALVRNMAVANARGDLIAFIDDDEFPGPTWLSDLLAVLVETKSDGVLGPVLPYYETPPPDWILKGKFHERPSHVTGTVLNWNMTRTGNVLLKKRLFSDKTAMFRREFGSGGEDRDFFKRMIGQGHTFVWCAEAPVFEVVPSERCTLSFMLRRAILRGKAPYSQTGVNCLKSLLAIPVYTLLLPLLVLTSHTALVNYLIRDCEHIGRILYFLKIDVIKEKYVTK